MILESAVICLALNIYHEARGEKLIGQHAVAQVTMNRAEWDESNVCKVVTAPKQFSWTNDLVARSKGHAPRLRQAGEPKDEAAWYLARGVAINTLLGKVPNFIGDATFYHSTSVAPSWSEKFKRVTRIGSHIFYSLPSKSRVTL